MSGDFEARLRLFDGLGRLRQVESAAMGVDIALDWVGARFAGREHQPGHFREDRRRGAFGELEQIEFRGVDPDLVGQRPGRNWKDDYCNVGQYQGGWDPDKCLEPMIAVDFIRDHVGRITDRTTTYGFPNGLTRDGSEFETTSFSYTPRGFLYDFESVGELLTGNFTDGHDYGREPALGSTEHLFEFGGGAALWSGLRNPDGRLTNVMTDNYSWRFDYDVDGKMVEYGDFELEYDGWKNLVAVHDTDSGQDFAESYIYDFAGRLVGTVSPLGHTDLWLHDGQNPVERWTASNSGSVGSAHIMGEYTWGQNPNQMLAARTKESGQQLILPLTDERQSIIGIFNGDKLLVDEYAQYDPDGRIRIRDNQDAVVCSEREMQEEPCHFDDLPHFGFTGAYRSTVTGLTLMGARWYSAQIGQFITPDPLWYIDSFDLYAYAGFDPVNRWDPTGLASDGLGSNFGTGQGHSSLIDRIRTDRGEQFGNITSSPGLGGGTTPTHGPGGGGGGGSGGSPTGEVAGWHQPLNWNAPFRAVENAFRSAADTNRELTDSNIQEHQSTLEESGGYSIASIYAQYRILQLRGWQILTPQTGDEAMFDAAMMPLGSAFAGFRFLRVLPSRAAPFARPGSIPGRIAHLTPGSAKEMLGESIGSLRAMRGNGATAREMADAFEDMAGQIHRQNPSWNASRSVGGDGSAIFAGEQGEALVISPNGGIFRGNLGDRDQFLRRSNTTLGPNYDLLRQLE